MNSSSAVPFKKSSFTRIIFAMTSSHDAQKTLDLSSEMSSLNQLNQFLEENLHWFQLETSTYHALQLAVSEAVSNAIMHGNKLDPSKKVSLEFHVDQANVRISVQDQGKGFNPDSLPDPLASDNLLVSGGRGIFIIRAYADSVHFEDEGRRLVMTFKKNA